LAGWPHSLQHGAPSETRKHGVFLSGLSHVDALLRPDAFYTASDPAIVNAKLLQDVRLLSLAFDVIHLPLAQLLFSPNPFFHRVASLFLEAPETQILARAGLLSSTFRGDERRLAIGTHLEQFRKIQWAYAALPSLKTLRAIEGLELGFDFDNARAGEMAAGYLGNKVRWCAAVFGGEEGGILEKIDATRGDNAGRFIMEDFLAKLHLSDVKSEKRQLLLRMIERAYNQEPNHLFAAVDGARAPEIKFCSYSDSITPEDVHGWNFSGKPIRYLYSPLFLLGWLSKWIQQEILVNFLTAKVSEVLEFHWSESRKQFSAAYHGDLIKHLSTAVCREQMFHDKRSAGSVEKLTNDSGGKFAPEIGGGSVLSEIAGSIKFGSAVTLALKYRPVANLVDNWARPELRRFVSAFADRFRTRKSFPVASGRT
jgi:hypothetical protein